MKSDQPFRKGLVLGSILFVLFYLFTLSIASHQERYFIKYLRIFLASFPPAILAAIWTFFSRKAWTWVRFSIVTIIFVLLWVTLLAQCINFLPDESPPIITFSEEIPSSWTVTTEPPITDMNSKPIGCQVLLESSDKKRSIEFAAINSRNDFEQNVTDWRTIMIERPSNYGFHIYEQNFTVDTNDQKTALLQLRIQKDNIKAEFICKAWMQKRFFVTCQAMGKDVEISNDTEIVGIISKVIIR